MRIIRDHFKRLAAVLLCAVVLLGALPLTPGMLPYAQAASWSTPYVDQLQQWGIMQGDGSGNMNEDRSLTRAGMVAMLNRAFGFHRTSPIPFTDVRPKDWFYSDIVTGYAEGIINGTSATTVSPNDPVTREQALTFLARCLRLEESPGEITEFTDGRQFSSWAAPYVRSAMLAGIINGGTDGSFRPGRNITRGEMAKMLATGLGTLINVRGSYSEGGVFGNLTINTAGVTLKDTTIAGDLYLTGGVGLGDVVLDNVKVLGRIVVAGGGESEDGEASILLNNVEAHKLLIDPSTGQYVSIRTIGSTDIPETIVTSNSYIQDDVRINSKGLRDVFLKAEEGAQFTVAGNMKNVINQTPGSTLIVGDTGDGSVTSITVDEEAVGSTLKLEINAAVDNVNLDTATKVEGSGDIGNLVVNTNGSVIDILPDKIVVRPGVITEIAGIPDVDSEKAKELSEDPKLLEGFPKARNIAPTSADGVFSTNKAGTLYWALTTAAVGPLTDKHAESMISPSYGSGFMQSGNMSIEKSKTEYTVNLTGLTEGGTYYLSALLVDAHGRRSPVKAQEILTPDGSEPAFAAEFPTITDRTPTRNKLNADQPYFQLVDVQASVMATKSCDLYYVLLPSGSSQPTTAEFLSHAFVDPFGYGRVRLVKNAMDSFKVNEVDMNLDGVSERLGELEESKEYDLYLWLTDADGTKSSKITKVTFTTKDITPPEFNGKMMQTGSQATSVQLTNSVNEDGTVYWVAVAPGSEYPFEPEYEATEEERLTFYQMQLMNGRNALKFGNVKVTKDKDFNINITGLEKESEYDVYCMAVDAAGNCSEIKKKTPDITVHTLDVTPPVPRQEFLDYPEDSPSTPYANSEIRVIFNETIQYRKPSNTTHDFGNRTLILHDMYAAANNPEATEEERNLYKGDLLAALKDMIVLYEADGNKPVNVKGTPGVTDENWVIDYEQIVIYRDEDTGDLVLSFPYNSDDSGKPSGATNLQSGATYYFQLKNIADTSERHNALGTMNLPEFTTVSAQIGVSRKRNGDLHINAKKTSTTDTPELNYEVDMAFTATPHSTSTAADGVYWDMLLWFDITCEFELFTRSQDPDNWDESKEWDLVEGTGMDGITRKTQSVIVPTGTAMSSASMIKNLGGGRFRPINMLFDEPSQGINGGMNDSDGMVHEYAIRFTKVARSEDRNTFSELVTGRVTFVSGEYPDLGGIITLDDVNGVTNTRVSNITAPTNYTMTRQFYDGKAPAMISKTPTFDTSPGGVSMGITLDRAGTVYYVLAPINKTTGVPVLCPATEPGRVSLPETWNGDSAMASREFIAYNLDDAGTYEDAIGHAFKPGDPGTPADCNYTGKTLTTGEVGTKYHFDFPTRNHIITPTDPDMISPLIVSGVMDAGSAIRFKNISGLAADTTYYVYLVTKGTTDVYSEVFVYQFRTKPITQPIITMAHNQATATITANQDATVKYKLVEGFRRSSKTASST